MARFRGSSDSQLRAEVLDRQRYLAELEIRLSALPGTTFPEDGLPRAKADGGAAARARMARYEAGGPIIVRAADVGGPADDRTLQLLAADGSLSPYAPSDNLPGRT